MQPLVPLVFHNLPSLYPPSFRRNDFLYFIYIYIPKNRADRSTIILGVKLSADVTDDFFWSGDGGQLLFGAVQKSLCSGNCQFVYCMWVARTIMILGSNTCED